jgi:hypothetical protein
MIEAWCICRFWLCWNAAKPQRSCQSVALGSQHLLTFIFFNWMWWRFTFNLKSWYMPVWQMTGNKHRISKIRKAIPSIIQNECLNMLKVLKPFKASNTQVATSEGWMIGKLQFCMSNISWCKATKSKLRLVWDQTPFRCCLIRSQLHWDSL